jgi:hypothetical protein
MSTILKFDLPIPFLHFMPTFSTFSNPPIIQMDLPLPLIRKVKWPYRNKSQINLREFCYFSLSFLSNVRSFLSCKCWHEMEERKDQKFNKVDIQKMIEIQVKKDAKSPNDKNKSKFKFFSQIQLIPFLSIIQCSRVSDIIH